MKANGIDFELEQDFKNYNEFLKSVGKHKPHVVIMDNIDSYDTFKLIKEMNKQGTKFIFINPEFKHSFSLSPEKSFSISNKEVFSLSQIKKI